MTSPPEIPFMDLARDAAEMGPDLQDAIGRVLASGRFVLGPEVEAFEGEFAEWCGVRRCVTTGSGTDALRLALAAAGVGPGDEVITVSHTFAATAFAVSLTGATPVFVDVDPETATMDPAAAEAAVTPATRALLPVHLYGQCADMDALRDVAGRHGLFLLEDAAQAHGATAGGRRAGSLGDAAAFSFYPTKILGALGDGGAVVTDDEELADRLLRLRNYGQTSKYRHESVAGNSRLDEVQAAVLRAKLRRAPERDRARHERAAAYGDALEGEGLALPRSAPGTEHAFHLYVVRTPRRDELAAHLEREGVGYGIHYPVPVHRQPAYGHLLEATPSLPVTDQLAGEVLSLPLFAGMTGEQGERAAAAVRRFAES